MTMSKYRDRQQGFDDGAGASTRPVLVTDAHLQYLDDLRVSGATNMYGAPPFLMDEFPDLDEKSAVTVLGYWMTSFGKADR